MCNRQPTLISIGNAYILPQCAQQIAHFGLVQFVLVLFDMILEAAVDDSVAGYAACYHIVGHLLDELEILYFFLS